MTHVIQRDLFQPFELERYQNKWENRVSYNLAESGVFPLTLGELLDVTGTAREEIDSLRLGYGQTDGSDELKRAVARMYPGAGPENILITVGSSEANFVTSWSLITPGTRIAIQTPTYKQIWGLAQNLGGTIAEFRLDGDRNWAVDLDSARRAIGPETDVVVVTNPNNPTGYLMTDLERTAVVELAAAADAWLVVDEVYRGAERASPLSDTFWGSGEKVIVIGGLSKAYGLPGLRIGWLVAPADFVEQAASRHDYTVIGASRLSDFLAVRALGVRDALLERARAIVRAHYETLEQWFAQHATIFSWTPPACGAICFPRYHLDIDSFDLVERLRQEQSVLLVPGSHFDRTNYVRIGFGYDRTELQAALARVGDALRTFAA